MITDNDCDIISNNDRNGTRVKVIGIIQITPAIINIYSSICDEFEIGNPVPRL